MKKVLVLLSVLSLPLFATDFLTTLEEFFTGKKFVSCAEPSVNITPWSRSETTTCIDAAGVSWFCYTYMGMDGTSQSCILIK